MEFQVSTPLSPQADEESMQKTKRIFRILFIVGIIGIIANIVISCVFYLDAENDPWWLEAELYVSAIVFALGLVIPITMNSITKKAQKNTQNVVNTYAFFDNYLLATSYRGEEKIGEAKNYYTEITKIKKTEHYVFLFLGTRGAYPIEIAALTEERLAWLLGVRERAKNTLATMERKEERDE